MQNLVVQILAILKRMTAGRSTPAPAPRVYRQSQVPRAAERPVHLKILSAAERRKFAPLITASIGTVVIAGFSGQAFAQSEEACAFVYELRSAYTIERVLVRFPNDPCIPILLEALSPQLLRTIDIDIIANLPASQLRRVSADVLEELGIRSSASTTTTRRVPRTTYDPY